jgi:hypothetical protein
VVLHAQCDGIVVQSKERRSWKMLEVVSKRVDEVVAIAEVVEEEVM